MAKEIRIPVPKFPDKLPFEGMIDTALDGIAKKLENAPPVRAVRAINDKLPYPRETEMNTPLGSVRLPPLNLPRLEPPEINDRKREAVKAAMGQDLSYLPGLIPVVGDIVADMVEDIFGAKINETLTPEEFNEFKRWDKKSPLSTVAMLQTFIRKGR